MQYEELLERYKVLVLFGPSCTGKSRLARALFGDSRALVVDVQHAAHPDLRAYRRGAHRAILLDEMFSPGFIVRNRKLLQAHVDGAILGQSATQLYTYKVFLWRTPIMITTINWDFAAFSDADKNCRECCCNPCRRACVGAGGSATAPICEQSAKAASHALDTPGLSRAQV